MQIYLNINHSNIPPELSLNEVFHLSLIAHDKYHGATQTAKVYHNLYGDEKAVKNVNTKLKRLGYIMNPSKGKWTATEKALNIFKSSENTQKKEKVLPVSNEVRKKLEMIFLVRNYSHEKKFELHNKIIQLEKFHKEAYKILSQRMAVLMDGKQVLMKEVKRYKEFNFFIFKWADFLGKELDNSDKEKISVNFLNISESNKLFMKFNQHMFDTERFCFFPNEEQLQIMERRKNTLQEKISPVASVAPAPRTPAIKKDSSPSCPEKMKFGFDYDFSDICRTCVYRNECSEKYNLIQQAKFEE